MDNSVTDQDYNQRQYDLMLRNLGWYQDGSIKLGPLVSNLDALRNALQNPTEFWLSVFEPAWGKLEDVFAVMLDEGRVSFNENDRRLIDEAIKTLTSLLSRDD